jgi:hypothetical protein
MRKSVSAVLGVVAVAAVVSVAYAEVIFDSGNGTGWVGKGDVQMAFELNNKGMQAVHTSVTFEYDNLTEYAWQCEWYTGPTLNVQHHSHPQTKTTGVQGSIASDSRKTGQWTGWHLEGFGSELSGTSGDFTPTCPGNAEGDGSSGEKTVVEGSVQSTSLGGGLFAVLNGDRRQIQ